MDLNDTGKQMDDEHYSATINKSIEDDFVP